MIIADAATSPTALIDAFIIAFTVTLMVVVTAATGPAFTKEEELPI